MPNPTNILIFIHGMIPKPDRYKPEEDPKLAYSNFVNGLYFQERNLIKQFKKIVYVKWGHESLNEKEPLRDDLKLTRAQKTVSNRVSYDAVRMLIEPNNILLPIDFSPLQVFRPLITNLRERTVLFGFGDVIYYCSKEGEDRVRNTVYEQILAEMEEFKEKKDVRLHIVSHSLGVTIAHDFLYGLFSREGGYKPDYIEEEQGSNQGMKNYKFWREKANKSLRLGTFIGMASQLPLFVMRKQKLVNLLYEDKELEAENIGIKKNEQNMRWLIFYDIDEILGFPTRNLYDNKNAIKDIQVNSGDDPGHAHEGYWTNPTVLRESAKLMFENCK